MDQFDIIAGNKSERTLLPLEGNEEESLLPSQVEISDEHNAHPSAEGAPPESVYARVDRIWEAVLLGLFAPTLKEKDDALNKASRLCEEMCSTEHRSQEVSRLLAEAQYLLAQDCGHGSDHRSSLAQDRE